ncbi:MAG: AzlD domain-containing protein [Aeromicrobium sp.]|uniref:branched-chain amino acid transporter permease n=1 Tax=Aeromicrobium sp. TaxID=1871063 RepID=UPI00262BA5A5|nr:AzlD domain-containing protein [Aeromicrobium sp.]MDF1704899.1 AzlD domain-containing protein [Aeromicrobium sp.]
MPDGTYLGSAIASAAAITVALRAAPFVLRSAVAGSALLADLGRWLPLGALVVLAISCLLQVEVHDLVDVLPTVFGVVATVAVHLWKRTMLLSLVVGTGACVAVTWLLGGAS